MNYTYLPSTPFTSTPTIIMTTNPASKKTHNLHANPRVSLLVHDWVSHRPPTRAPDPTREGSPPPQATNSSLAALLLNMNTSAMSRISVTINGEAEIVDLSSEEERWCKDAHLQNNTFREHETAEESTMLNSSPTEVVGDGGRGYFIEDEDVRVVVVKIKDGRIADWKGGIQDWAISGQSDSADSNMVNGV
ncbi:MAG: hypothetical protein M1831_002804 [Alyxoria varia]|nr:MAG: hypothetical protein M1831_002804 [Alyxoria varia]